MKIKIKFLGVFNFKLIYHWKILLGHPRPDWHCYCLTGPPARNHRLQHSHPGQFGELCLAHRPSAHCACGPRANPVARARCQSRDSRGGRTPGHRSPASAALQAVGGTPFGAQFVDQEVIKRLIRVKHTLNDRTNK